jgi:hypothetical protein
MLKKMAELCGEMAFDELGLRTSAGTGNLEDALGKTGQRVAADEAAVASVMMMAFSVSGPRGWTYLEM